MSIRHTIKSFGIVISFIDTNDNNFAIFVGFLSTLLYVSVLKKIKNKIKSAPIPNFGFIMLSAVTLTNYDE
jgi:hypothetical protein